MTTNRRSFIKGAAIGSAGVAATAASSLPAPAIAQERREWRMVTSWPRGLPGVGTGAERLAERITTMSEGRITVELFPAGELVPALQVWDAVSDGTAQLGHDASYYHIGKTEGAAFYTAFPYGFTPDEITAWVTYGGGQELWDELYEPFNLRGFLAGNTGVQTFGWLREPINSVEDLDGLRFRAPGNQGRVLGKLGVTVVLLPGGEIFPALQAGTIDGAEWIGPYNDLSFGLYQVCPYYYFPGYHEPGSALQMTVNREEYESLPSDLQQLLRVAAEAANSDMTAEYNAFSGPSLRTLVTEHGVQLNPLPEDVLLACGEASNEVLNEVYEAGDPITRRIIESYFQFRRDAIPWSRIGSQAYLGSRLLPFAYEITSG